MCNSLNSFFRRSNELVHPLEVLYYSFYGLEKMLAKPNISWTTPGDGGPVAVKVWPNQLDDVDGFMGIVKYHTVDTRPQRQATKATTETERPQQPTYLTPIRMPVEVGTYKPKVFSGEWISQKLAGFCSRKHD